MSKEIKIYNTLSMKSATDGFTMDLDVDGDGKEYENDLYSALEADDTNLAPYADDYHGDSYYNKLIETKITIERVNGKLFGVAICTVSDDWTNIDTEQLKKYLSGQYSDGWGEGFEQFEIATYEDEDEFYDEDEEEYYYDDVTYYIYVSFWQSNGFKIMTEDELKEYLGK